jgi:soluble lytic murein transglycosylase-like protein
VLMAICHYETRGEADPVNAQGELDEEGICQIRFSTAVEMGYLGIASGLADSRTNIRYAAKWLKHCQRLGAGSIRQLAMCYNEGRFTETSKTKYSGHIANVVQHQRMILAMAPQVVMR